MNSATHFKKAVIHSAVVLALGMGTGMGVNAAFAAGGPTTGNNFTMLTPDPGTVWGGDTNVTAEWADQTCNTSADSTNFNMNLSPSIPFSGYMWTAHHIRVFGPGTYTINTECTTTDLDNGTCTPNADSTKNYTLVVGQGKIGVHMLFDWNGNLNIDVVNVWSRDGQFVPNDLTGSTVWDLVSTDPDGDGTNGVPMLASDSPFPLWNANFNLEGISPPANNAACGTALPIPIGFNDFASQSGVALNTAVTSATYTVQGIGTTDISISAPVGVTAQYSVNSTTVFTSSPGTVQDNDVVRVRVTSAATYATLNRATLTIGGGSANFDVTTTKGTPTNFSFASKTDVPTSTWVSSDPYTVGGLGAGLSASISVSGGEYSRNGGATFTSTSGTVADGDSIIVRVMSNATGGAPASASLTIGELTASFTVTTEVAAGTIITNQNNFTMISPSGSITGGTNDVVFVWDGQSTTNNDSNDFTHMSLSSITPFASKVWTAHHIRVFAPGGPYVINTTCTVPQLEAGNCAPNADPTKNYTFIVATGQIGTHMLFDWSTSSNIDVVNIWSEDQVFSPSPMHKSPDGGCNDPATVWDLMSTDWDGDGKNGGAMIDGPFKGFSANFNTRLPGSPILPCSTTYTPTVNVDDPSGASGCSISPKPVNVLERGDWWLVAGFLAWLGALRKRFKHQA